MKIGQYLEWERTMSLQQPSSIWSASCTLNTINTASIVYVHATQKK